jgi:hypothetical protein
MSRKSLFTSDRFINDKTGKSVKVVFGKTRVILISTKLKPAPHDPVWGSVHSCIGTVTTYYNDMEHPFLVKWSGSNKQNGYSAEELQIYGAGQKIAPNPNASFKRKKEGMEKPFKFGDAPLKPKNKSFKEMYVYDEKAFFKYEGG